MGWPRFTLRTMLVGIAGLAAGIAVFGVAIGSILSTAALIVALRPLPSRWQTWELAATVTWLLGSVLAFSNVHVDGLSFMFFQVVGVVLSTSWALREANRESKPASLIAWATLLFVPTSMLLVVVLAVTDLDLRLRLAVSESALRADVRRIVLGHEETLKRQERRVGLFWVRDVEEVHNCVFWTTGGVFMNHHGLAYSRNGMPTHLTYEFRHIRGPWWGFEFNF